MSKDRIAKLVVIVGDTLIIISYIAILFILSIAMFGKITGILFGSAVTVGFIILGIIAVKYATKICEEKNKDRG